MRCGAMIEVKINRADLSIHMRGHAGAMQENGIDAVCAAASMILFTLIYSASKDMKDYKLMNVDSWTEKGNAYVKLHTTQKSRDRAQAKYDMACDGLEMLSIKYPGSIKVSRG